MGRTGTPVRVAPGIYRHTTRFRVTAKAAGHQREAHYPLDADLKEMQRWQLRTKSQLLDEPRQRTTKGSLRADVVTYLTTLTGRRKKDERALLQHWLETPLGDLKRATISRAQVKAQLALWEDGGVAAGSLNHRLRALRNLYRELDADDDAPNPTEGIRKRREPEPKNHAFSYDLIEAIIAWMPDYGTTAKRGQPRSGQSLGKARARVLLWTGLPPAQLMQLQRADFDEANATLRVMPRRKGKGTKGVTIPVLPQAVNALKLFFAAKAEGRFSTQSFYKQWQGAQKRLLRELRRVAVANGVDPSLVTLPGRIRPYDLRHSFGAEAARVSNNLLGIQKLMLHAKLTTTQRYLQGAVDESASRVIDIWGRTGS